LIDLNREHLIRLIEHSDRSRDFDWERAPARGGMNNQDSEKQYCDQGYGC
jgi:hypothetical protein